MHKHAYISRMIKFRILNMVIYVFMISDWNPKKILIEKVQNLLEEHSKKRDEAVKNNLLEKYMKTGKLAREMWNKKF